MRAKQQSLRNVGAYADLLFEVCIRVYCLSIEDKIQIQPVQLQKANKHNPVGSKVAL